jgi:hypothetical protein
LLGIETGVARNGSGAKIFLHLFRYLLGSFRTYLALYSPAPTRMKHIPTRTHSLITALAGIVISETVYDSIPDWSKFRDQQRLAERNPNIVHDKKATVKVPKLEILRRLNAFGMLLESTE